MHALENELRHILTPDEICTISAQAVLEGKSFSQLVIESVCGPLKTDPQAMSSQTLAALYAMARKFKTQVETPSG